MTAAQQSDWGTGGGGGGDWGGNGGATDVRKQTSCCQGTLQRFFLDSTNVVNDEDFPLCVQIGKTLNV